MAVRSREYVGIAEGIKSHEISTKRRIENLNNTINELSSYKNSLEWDISSIEAQIDAARSQTDEEGNPDPDYGLIAQLESQKRQVESDLKKTEDDLDKAHGELREATDEFEQVMEEKERTLFEIQERARNTSANISKAGGMVGAYSGVGTNLQSAFQASFDSLSQAANILDGSVGGVGGGYGGRGSASGGRSNGGSGSSGYNDTSTSPLSAFMKNANGDGSYVPSPSDFHSEQSGRLTPATSNNFNYGNGNLGSAKLINYSSTQSANSYANSSFLSASTENAESSNKKYQSEQVSSDIKPFTQNGTHTKCFSIGDIKNISTELPKIALSDEDRATFQNGEYLTFRLNDPITAYRYFGCADETDVSVARGITNTSHMEWGSDAGGRFMCLNPYLSSEMAQNLLALKPEWGNNQKYRSTIEIPAGTIIFVGRAASQKCNDVTIVNGGELQILIQEWTTENTREWIKRIDEVKVCLIPKLEGKIKGDSNKLKKNMVKEFDVPLELYDEEHRKKIINYIKKSKMKGYQAQHIIPSEVSDHKVILAIKMDINHAQNGIFLPEPDGQPHTFSTHKGYHSPYSKAVKKYLDDLWLKYGGENPDIDKLEIEVFKLQNKLKRALEKGLPIYGYKDTVEKNIKKGISVEKRGGGSSEEMWLRVVYDDVEINQLSNSIHTDTIIDSNAKINNTERDDFSSRLSNMVKDSDSHVANSGSEQRSSWKFEDLSKLVKEVPTEVQRPQRTSESDDNEHGPIVREIGYE